jgi:hypothetical protein
MERPGSFSQTSATPSFELKRPARFARCSGQGFFVPIVMEDNDRNRPLALCSAGAMR